MLVEVLSRRRVVYAAFAIAVALAVLASGLLAGTHSPPVHLNSGADTPIVLEPQPRTVGASDGTTSTTGSGPTTSRPSPGAATSSTRPSSTAAEPGGESTTTITAPLALPDGWECGKKYPPHDVLQADAPEALYLRDQTLHTAELPNLLLAPSTLPGMMMVEDIAVPAPPGADQIEEPIAGAHFGWIAARQRRFTAVTSTGVTELTERVDETGSWVNGSRIQAMLGQRAAPGMYDAGSTFMVPGVPDAFAFDAGTTNSSVPVGRRYIYAIQFNLGMRTYKLDVASATPACDEFVRIVQAAWALAV